MQTIFFCFFKTQYNIVFRIVGPGPRPAHTGSSGLPLQRAGPDTEPLRPGQALWPLFGAQLLGVSALPAPAQRRAGDERVRLTEQFSRRAR